MKLTSYFHMKLLEYTYSVEIKIYEFVYTLHEGDAKNTKKNGVETKRFQKNKIIDVASYRAKTTSKDFLSTDKKKMKKYIEK